MTQQTIEFSLQELTELVTAALTALGLTDDDRRVVTRVLLWAELRGNSQGLGKIPARAVAPDPNAGEMVVMDRAVDEAVLSAKNNGIGIVGTRGTATSTGAIGYFAECAAEQEFICIILAARPRQSHLLVAPTLFLARIHSVLRSYCRRAIGRGYGHIG
jgi:LDH2 family malate/lactate/ureidoglycolate dehydrogenase